MVLLKNEKNTLPIRKGTKVALFGKGTVDYVKGGGGSGTSSQSADEVYGDTKGRKEGLDKGWTEPGDFTGLKGSQRSPVLSPAKGAFHCGGLRSISGIFREISRRLPQSDEAKGSPKQSD